MNKGIKKLNTILFSVILCLSFSVTAFAEKTEYQPWFASPFLYTDASYFLLNFLRNNFFRHMGIITYLFLDFSMFPTSFQEI
jgi:hypothetical protein